MVGMLLLASVLTLSIGVAQGNGNKGLIMKLVTPEKIEGETMGRLVQFCVHIGPIKWVVPYMMYMHMRKCARESPFFSQT